jgi:hypothetical protein
MGGEFGKKYKQSIMFIISIFQVFFCLSIGGSPMPTAETRTHNKANELQGIATHDAKSCDALYRSNNAHWFLIEFKMGNIDNTKIYEIRGKVFESLLLLTEQLDETICFTREYCTFILVYNNGRQNINRALNNLHNNKSTPLIDRLYCFKNLYFNDVCVYSPQEFEREFVNKHFP